MSEIYDPKGLLNLEFHCPQCGGSMFGTSNGLPAEATGHCHGYLADGSRCKFTWPRAQDDELGVFAKRQSNAQSPPTPGSALELAMRFHEAYERLAPRFGYETKPETREFDPQTTNGRLMIAVCREIIEQNTPHQPERTE